MLTFKTPLLLLLIPVLVPFLVYFYVRRKDPAVAFPSSRLFENLPTTWRTRFRWLPFLLRLLAVLFFIVALAGPRTLLEETRVSAEGINIVLLVDTSTSMAAEDFKINGQRVNRLEVIKDVVKGFIEKRKTDRLGLIAFSGKPYTVCPLTTDYSWLEQNLERIDFGLMEDGTAIGSAIASGVNRLRNVEGKSRVVILLTDGINNAGKIDPLTAARTAAAYGIKVYTIGAGTRGLAPYPVIDMFGRKRYQNVQIEIDEETLRNVAEATGGQYFRATDTESLQGIYDQIDKMEKVEFQETGYRQYEEHFDKVLLTALLLLLIEVVLSRTVFLRIP